MLLELEMGPLKIKRASNIEFNEKNQKWEVNILGEGILASFSSRQKALEWEVQYLEKQMESLHTLEEVEGR